MTWLNKWADTITKLHDTTRIKKKRHDTARLKMARHGTARQDTWSKSVRLGPTQNTIDTEQKWHGSTDTFDTSTQDSSYSQYTQPLISEFLIFPSTPPQSRNCPLLQLCTNPKHPQPWPPPLPQQAVRLQALHSLRDHLLHRNSEKDKEDWINSIGRSIVQQLEICRRQRDCQLRQQAMRSECVSIGVCVN